MTSPRTAARARRLSRDQAVAALLVGAVVILLGFASGLGLDPAASTSSAAQPVPSTSAPEAAPTTAAAPAATTTPPVAYVAVPAPPAAPVVVAPVTPESTAPVSAPRPRVTSPVSTPSTSPASSPAPSSGSSAPPTCSPGLLTALLGALLPSAGDSAGGLLGLGSLLQSIDQVAGASQLLTGGSGGLLHTVTGLLALPSVLPGGRTSTGLATSCTGDVQAALQLIAAGEDVPTAVRSAGR